MLSGQKDMKIKVLPEDFIVTELTSFPINKSGDYNVYRLDKKYWNTLDALQYIARKNNLPLSQLSYGGKKDRYALTSQHITVFRTKLDLDTGMDNLKLTFLGKSNRHFTPSDINSNRFQTVIRDLTQSDSRILLDNFFNISKYGFPNYFGEQRFGSYDERCGFFGEKFLKAQYNGAVKAAICSVFPQDKSSDKKRKQLFFEHWGDFEYCLKFAKTHLEKRVFSYLKDNPRKFIDTIHLLPLTDVSTYFTAYQSYLWNRMLDKILVKHVLSDTKKIFIKNWSLTSYTKLFDEELEFFKSLKLPSHGLNPYFSSDEIERFYDETLKEEGLHQGRFNFRHYRKVIIKSFQREAIVFPINSTANTPESDEIYKGKLKVTLTFELPKGAFATTLIKHLE